jgi:exonuclease III
MLIGLRDNIFEVGAIEIGTFFVSVSVLRRSDNLMLEIMGIYGPADHSLSLAFLEEILAKIARTVLPLILGGDFNLMQSEEDKNKDIINWPRIDMFNDHIANWVVRELPRTGARYTWSNRQLNPTRCVLDRVFILPALEPRFHLCSLVAETSLESDHTPLLFDTRQDSEEQPLLF